MILTPQDIFQLKYYWRVGCHEAGHLVVAKALNCLVERVTLIEQPITMVRDQNPAFDLDQVRRHVAVHFAGYLAERRAYSGRRSATLKSAASDFCKIRFWDPQRHPLRWTVVRRHFGLAEEWQAFLREQLRLADRILQHNWRTFCKVTVALVGIRELKDDELYDLLDLVEPYPVEPSRVFEALTMRAAA